MGSGISCLGLRLSSEERATNRSIISAVKTLGDPKKTDWGDDQKILDTIRRIPANAKPEQRLAVVKSLQQRPDIHHSTLVQAYHEYLKKPELGLLDQDVQARLSEHPATTANQSQDVRNQFALEKRQQDIAHLLIHAAGIRGRKPMHMRYIAKHIGEMIELNRDTPGLHHFTEEHRLTALTAATNRELTKGR